MDHRRHAIAPWDSTCIARVGLAELTRRAYLGEDLGPLWNEMLARVTDDALGAGIGMDLSVIAQLRGDKPMGLAIQKDALQYHQVFTASSRPGPSTLRVLALGAASDIGANTPIDFLVKGQDIAVAILYFGDEVPEPQSIPAHDVAIVVAPASRECDGILDHIEGLQACWPAPLLNTPNRIRGLDRDRLFELVADIKGLQIPVTLCVTRETLACAPPLVAPFIIRPIDSHAGFGLEKIEGADGLSSYLARRAENTFFVSPYLDYRSSDGLFRKYRIAVIDGVAFPVHMAIAEEWKVWYLNADMALSVSNRTEEGLFMHCFEQSFGKRHAAAISQMADRLGLEYFLVDCAETADGDLLVFEADNCAIVHDMDPESVYPYKAPHMKALFAAFGAMLRRHAGSSVSDAA